MECMREEARWGWPAEGPQCQRRQPCYGLIYSASGGMGHIVTFICRLLSIQHIYVE